MEEKESLFSELKIKLDNLEKVHIPPADIILFDKLQQLHETICEIKVKQSKIIAQKTHIRLETTNQDQSMQKRV